MRTGRQSAIKRGFSGTTSIPGLACGFRRSAPGVVCKSIGHCRRARPRWPRRGGDATAFQPRFNLGFWPTACLRAKTNAGRKALLLDQPEQRRPISDDVAIFQIGEPQKLHLAILTVFVANREQNSHGLSSVRRSALNPSVVQKELTPLFERSFLLTALACASALAAIPQASKTAFRKSRNGP